MADRWTGVDVSGEGVVAVTLEASGSGRPYTVIGDETLKLPTGERPQAYVTIFRRVRDFIKEGKVKVAVIKASAVPPRAKATNALLHAAELRGVVAAAMAEGGAEVRVVSRAAVNREFGERDLGEYLSDNKFWTSAVAGQLRNGSRTAAILVVNELEPQ